jgi:lysophospholipase L1-like esterase
MMQTPADPKLRDLRKLTRSILPEFLVLVVSVCLVFGGLEIYLRQSAVGKAKPYEGIETMPDVADTYFQLVFLQNYVGKKVWFPADHDPQLGWDYKIASNRLRGGKKAGPKSDSTFRIITLGDSFTWGIDVGDTENYPYYLEKTLQGVHGQPAEVLNMGVGSYGLDQAVLKYGLHGQPLRPDLVVLGIFPHDYDRTRLSFYSYSKPLFQYEDAAGAYVLANVPVPPPKEMYEKLARKHEGASSYALAFLKNRLIKLFHSVLNPSDPNRYYSTTDRLVEFLLLRLRGDLDKVRAGLFIVHIPRGECFESDKALAIGRNETQTVRLKALYEKLKIPSVDLLEALPKRFPLGTIHRDFYVHREDGTLGHFTPRGNAEVAKIIAEELKTEGLLKRSGR